jgi:fructan beta-fructosidase
VGYDPVAKEVFLDRTRSGEAAFHADFPARHRAPLEPEKGIIRLHIFVDRCSVEVYANNGRRVITDLIFPGPTSDRLEIYARGGAAKLRSLDAWTLNSAWQ